MTRRAALGAAAGVALLGAATARAQAPVATAPAPAPSPPPLGEIKPLGDDRFQIGRIVVDKRARRFTVPGRVHALGEPLEYLAASPGGMKAYETLFELDAGGTLFNLACILIGLERRPGDSDWRHQDDALPLVGARVRIDVAWQDASGRRQVPAAQAVLNPEADTRPETVEWVYIGAPASEISGRFTAEETGTLVGFKRDANNVIESALPIGLGAYGTVRGHPMLPPKGSPVEFIVEAVARGR